MAETLTKYPNLMRPFFVFEDQAPLTGGKTTFSQYYYIIIIVYFPLAEIVKTLFTKIHFSEQGSNERNVEEATYMLFMDFLHDCEGKHDSCCHASDTSQLCRW